MPTNQILFIFFCPGVFTFWFNARMVFDIRLVSNGSHLTYLFHFNQISSIYLWFPEVIGMLITITCVCVYFILWYNNRRNEIEVECFHLDSIYAEFDGNFFSESVFFPLLSLQLVFSLRFVSFCFLFFSFSRWLCPSIWPCTISTFYSV